MPQHCIALEDVQAAYARISSSVNETPIHTSSYITSISKRQNVFFKVEAFQKTGSFKYRGAANAVLSLLEERNSYSSSSSSSTSAPLSVVTHSSGNHAAALSLAAQNTHIPAHIIMPSTAPKSKRDAVEITYSGIVTVCEPTSRAREEAADGKLKCVEGSVFIHPSENPYVIAGQGTIAIEFVQQLQTLNNNNHNKLDLVIIPVGGGGLAAGNLIALKGLLGDTCKVVLAEPEVFDDAKRSYESQTLCGNDGKVVSTVADGLKTTLGTNTFGIIKDLADGVITVSERAILEATKLVWQRMKILIEPSAGVGVAVLLSDEFLEKFPPDVYRNVGVILCGGNVDVGETVGLMKEMGI